MKTTNKEYGMKSKVAQIQEAISRGDNKKAISIASKFFDKSEETKIFKSAQSAMLSPDFYRQIGKDPDEMISLAVVKIKEKFCQAK
jgi:hypothetical protein